MIMGMKGKIITLLFYLCIVLILYQAIVMTKEPRNSSIEKPPETEYQRQLQMKYRKVIEEEKMIMTKKEKEKEENQVKRSSMETKNLTLRRYYVLPIEIDFPQGVMDGTKITIVNMKYDQEFYILFNGILGDIPVSLCFNETLTQNDYFQEWGTKLNHPVTFTRPTSIEITIKQGGIVLVIQKDIRFEVKFRKDYPLELIQRISFECLPNNGCYSYEEIKIQNIPIHFNFDIKSYVTSQSYYSLAMRKIDNNLKKETLFVGITSSPQNSDKRQAIRRTWMTHPKVQSGEVTALFFIGKMTDEGPIQGVDKLVEVEMEKYKDIILLPLVEDYLKITHKTIEIFRYMENTSASYLLKCDDDTFSNLDQVLNLLSTQPKDKGELYLGYIADGLPPMRHEGAKWYVTKDEFSEERYPAFALGSGYILSRGISRYIVERIDKGDFKIFKFEDVAVGLWMRESIGRGERVSIEYVYGFHHNKCEDKIVYTSHRTPPFMMMCMWKKVLNHESKICCNDPIPFV